MEKLVCDRCGFELTEKQDVFLALDGIDAWCNAQKARGQEPRGVFPCKYYFQCKGEMILITEKDARKRKKGLFGQDRTK
ncbi:MAG: hypothetical protein Q8O43_01040 [Dehalococcoidia bacterium]|nr:hypothetical protein [Dehalococcoidia bacterium]